MLSHRFASTWLLLPALLTNGCARALNYGEPDGPRFAGSYAAIDDSGSFDRTLDVVTLNIQFSLRIEQAQHLFDRVEELGRADVVLLQEMDAAGTEALAAHLGMAYVYYPATIHPKTSRDFGNAILSRWPISRDRKVQLPHHGFSDGSQRTATCATVRTPVEPLEVCSLHLATPVELSPRARREQALAAVSALTGAKRVVVGGDFNSHRVGNALLNEGFDWPTRDIGKTRGFFSLDHLFSRGLAATSAGKVSDTLGATDHAAVWARFAWR